MGLLFNYIILNVSVMRPAIFTKRCFSTGISIMNKNLSREARFFNKFLSDSPKKKRKLYFGEVPIPSHAGGFHFGKNLKQDKENSRRIAVLNSVFMRHISDILMTGNLATNVLDKGLQISRVAMTSNFNQLNVFWVTNSSENLEKLEASLPDLGYTLRHELTQLRVVGVVPRVVFIKDKHHSNALKVDHLLSIADYGEDHAPLVVGSDFKGTIDHESKDLKPSTEDCKNLEQCEDQIVVAEETMPKMRQDTFNLNHEQILNKILKKLNKSRALHRFQPNLSLDSEGSNTPTHKSVDKMTKEERKKAIDKFVLNRRIMIENQKQDKRKINNTILAYDAHNYSDDDDFENFHVEDYIEEDYIDEQNFKNQ